MDLLRVEIWTISDLEGPLDGAIPEFSASSVSGKGIAKRALDTTICNLSAIFRGWDRAAARVGDLV